jgi:hypothetical protein
MKKWGKAVGTCAYTSACGPFQPALRLLNEPPVPIKWRMGGPQSLCGRYGEEKNIFLLLEIKAKSSSS